MGILWYELAMPTTPALRSLEFDEASAAVDRGAAFVDLRSIASYLEVHISGSLALLYEFGPGMSSRARDCLPLSLPLVLLDLGHGDLEHAAASLRGKGFTVLGQVSDGINRWAAAGGSPVSTEIVSGTQGLVLDVGDPGSRAAENALTIPVDRLWARIEELDDEEEIVVASGYGVRAALAVGILERFGHEVAVWHTRAS
jgi:rhodanese-related sulfurtransferase